MDDQQAADDSGEVDYLVSPEGGGGVSSTEGMKPPRVERPTVGVSRPAESAGPPLMENNKSQIDTIRVQLGQERILGDQNPAMIQDNERVVERVVVVEKPMSNEDQMWNTAFDTVGKGISLATKVIGGAVDAVTSLVGGGKG
jgi:hypothetical protein